MIVIYIERRLWFEPFLAVNIIVLCKGIVRLTLCLHGCPAISFPIANAEVTRAWQAMDVDKFVSDHPDFVVVTSVGDQGQTAVDSTVWSSP